MPTSPISDTPQWILNRILGFFNAARQVSDILDGTIQDDPTDGPGSTIGPVLAARILRERNLLPRRRFTDFAQFDAIRGVGKNTLQDLIYSFKTSADEAFLKAMYEGTIYPENWPLEYFRTEIEDKDAFKNLTSNPAAFRAWVVEKVKSICSERNIDATLCQPMLEQLKSAYIDTYHNSSPTAGYALALWFYEFDSDNWFSWENIQQKTIGYFEYSMNSYPWNMELRFFKGFEQKGILRPGITPPDFPVVVNEAEQTITLWFSALYD